MSKRAGRSVRRRLRTAELWSQACARLTQDTLEAHETTIAACAKSDERLRHTIEHLQRYEPRVELRDHHEGGVSLHLRIERDVWQFAPDRGALIKDLQNRVAAAFLGFRTQPGRKIC